MKAKLIGMVQFWAAITTIIFLSGPSFSASNDSPAVADLVPPETAILVEIENLGRLRTQLKQTNFYKLYKDPAMAAFVKHFEEKLSDLLRHRIGESLCTSDLLPDGRVGLAAVLRPNEGEMDSTLFVARLGKARDKIKQAIAKAVEDSVERGWHKRTEQFRGEEIVSIIKELGPQKVPDFSKYNPEDDNNIPMKTVQPPPEKMFFCLAGDWQFISDNIDIIKFAVAHIKGATSPTLLSGTVYADTRKAVGPYHDIDLYINIKQIIKSAVAKDETSKTKNTINNLGLDNVVCLFGSIGVARKAGSDFYSKALLKIEGEKKGLCKMLDLKSSELRPPSFIPASACSISFFNIDIKGFFDELARVLSAFSPQSASVLYMPLIPPTPQGQPGLTLRQDVIEHLGSQIIIAQSLNKPFTQDLKFSDAYFAIEVTNRSALEKSLSMIHSRLLAANKPDARRELLGHTIYLVDLPSLFPVFSPGIRTPLQETAQPGPTEMPSFAFTVTDTHLLFGTESTIEKAIRALSLSDASSLRSAQWFIKGKSSLPSAVGLAGIKDSRATTELSWWLYKQCDKLEKTDGDDSSVSINLKLNRGFGLDFSGEDLGLFDFGLLPDYDKVKKYFGLSVYYGISRPDGFFFEFKDLKAAE